MIWLLLFVPIAATVILAVLFRHRTTWWEYCLPLGVTTVLLFIVTNLHQHFHRRDFRYVTSALARAVYYEPWDERVPCIHSKYRTETYTYRCGDATCTGTRQVYDGTQHLYDVAYHPPRWVVEDRIGRTFDISSSEFEALARKFKSRKFWDQNRNYHSRDGDAYASFPPASHIEPIVGLQTYDNPIQGSASLYNRELSEAERLLVIDYPESPPLDSWATMPRQKSNVIERFNARFGSSHEIHVWVLFFGSAPEDVGRLQETYWKGGNDNELVICIGRNGTKASWVHVFSWTKDEQLKIELRDFILGLDGIDLDAIAQHLETRVLKRWSRRDLSDFNYLQSRPSTTGIVSAVVLSILASIATAFCAIHNEKTPTLGKRFRH